MKSSSLAAIIVTILVAVGVGIFFVSRDSSETTKNSTTSQSDQSNDTEQIEEDDSEPADSADTTNSSDLAGAPTREQVALHATEEDCWTIIDGVVYDITSYIPRHKGGDNILSACGVDATDFFNGERAGQEGGTNDHSSDNQALTALENMKVGELAE